MKRDTPDLRMSSWSSVLYLVFVLTGLVHVVSSGLYCPDSVPCLNQTHVQTSTREEFGYIDASEELVCEVDNQCPVTWFIKHSQNGSHIPLNATGRFKLSCNNTMLNIEPLEEEDDETYFVCRADCGDCQQENQILLQASESKSTTLTIVKQDSCTDQYVSPGGDATFCCECQMETNTLNNGFMYWFHDDIVLVPKDERALEKFSYNNRTSIGSCITISNVTDDQYGNYSVYCDNLYSRNRAVEFLQLLPEYRPDEEFPPQIFAVLLLVVLLAPIALLKIDIQLAYKDKFGKHEVEDGKLYDAYISYSRTTSDRRHAMYLYEKLSRLGYSISMEDRTFDFGEAIADEISRSLQSSRRCLILLSPDYVQHRFMTFEMSQCLDAERQTKKHIIPLFLCDTQEEDIKRDKTLSHIVSSHARLNWHAPDGNMPDGKCILPTCARWREQRTWKTLLLQLPRRPRCATSGGSVALDSQGLDHSSLIDNEGTEHGFEGQMLRAI
ncbi:interleukin-1 receptor accessory protein-like 1 [Diadema setosum]|uniref:interleukin-1 receptor accessory protein-like 1 n=1 Tax=Diadema setosum TaxID=31175 RepID=UPI003B3B7609